MTGGKKRGDKGRETEETHRSVGVLPKHTHTHIYRNHKEEMRTKENKYNRIWRLTSDKEFLQSLHTRFSIGRNQILGAQ